MGTTVARRNRSYGALWVVLGLAAAIALVWFAILGLMDDGGPKKRHTVHNVAILRPPPPPPPPPKQERPPEPPKEELKIKAPEPVPDQPPQSEQPPAGDRLGVDADGTAGSDGFGLQANRGGRDLLATAPPTIGGGGDRFSAFAARLQRLLQAELARDQRLRSGEYRVEVRVWIAPDGAIERAELVAPTGNAAVDESLRSALTSMPRLAERPPENMPQPVRLRITSRTAG